MHIFKFVTSDKRDMFKALFYDKRKVKLAFYTWFIQNIRVLNFMPSSLPNNELPVEWLMQFRIGSQKEVTQVVNLQIYYTSC